MVTLALTHGVRHAWSVSLTHRARAHRHGVLVEQGRTRMRCGMHQTGLGSCRHAGHAGCESQSSESPSRIHL